MAKQNSDFASRNFSAELIAMAKASGLSEEELFSWAIAPSDPLASNEEKIAALRRALGIAEALDEQATEYASKQGAYDPEQDHRLYTRLALAAIIEFLKAIGAGSRERPSTLWRLLRGLAELDDSGNVSALFQTKLSGRPKPTHRALAIRSVAAAQLELRFEQQGRQGLNAAASDVAAAMTSIGPDAPSASAIKQCAMP
jgi:hypothetical protein